MSACFEAFPEERIHEKETYTFTITRGKLQAKLIRTLQGVNRRTFTFEQFGSPTVPECTVIFELGIADSNNFTFIDENEAKKLLATITKEPFPTIDLFCAIRYYKDYTSVKKPLKFDYYLARFIFGQNALEMQVFHERGPRYVSPHDVVRFLVDQVNAASARKTLKQIKRAPM